MDDVEEVRTDKHDPSFVAPIRILNEHRLLNDLAHRCKSFREFKTPWGKRMPWTGLLCPQREPYNLKAWEIKIEVPCNYPQKPPKIKFITPMYHPNVSSDTGEIKLAILENTEWKDLLTIIDVLKALLYMVYNPNVEDENLILNEDAAEQYKDDIEAFNEKVLEFSKCQALERPPDPKPWRIKKVNPNNQ